MRRSYGTDSCRRGHFGGDALVVILTLALVAGVVLQRGGIAVVGAMAVVAVVAGRRRLAVAVLAVAMLGAVRSEHSWAAVARAPAGTFHGWAVVVEDPALRGGSTAVVWQIEGERFVSRLYGSASRRAARLAAGDRVLVSGRRRSLGGGATTVRRLQVRHVVGRFDLEVLADVRAGPAVVVAANRVRSLLRSAGDAVMLSSESALFTGLVVGDDQRQPTWLLERFRAAGLSHLCAVSGQNVGYFMALLSPLLSRLRPTARAVAASVALAWFCLLTRFEPSVLRAGVMAVLSTWATWRGREVSPWRGLALAVGVLLMADPMLAWSVGFWLSVGATAGVSCLAPAALRWVSGSDRLPGAVAVTLGAQVGVALPSALVFGRLPVVALPANLLAVPVAGIVMLWGFPASVLHGLAPDSFGRLAMYPCTVGTRWVSSVAAASAAVDLTPWWNAVGWLVVVAVVALWARRMRARRTRMPS